MIYYDSSQVLPPPVVTPASALLAAQQRALADRARGLGASVSPSASIMGAVSGAMGKSVQQVTFRSQLTPAWNYNPGAPAAPSPATDFAMRLLKPQIEIHTPAGPVVLAPYGSPTVNLFPLVVLGVLGAAAGAGYLMLRGLRS